MQFFPFFQANTLEDAHLVENLTRPQSIQVKKNRYQNPVAWYNNNFLHHICMKYQSTKKELPENYYVHVSFYWCQFECTLGYVNIFGSFKSK